METEQNRQRQHHKPPCQIRSAVAIQFFQRRPGPLQLRGFLRPQAAFVALIAESHHRRRQQPQNPEKRGGDMREEQGLAVGTQKLPPHGAPEENQGEHEPG